MNLARIGKRVLNFDNVLYCEHQVYQDDETVKIYMAGASSNTPLVFCDAEAKAVWQYLEQSAKPVL